MTGGAPLGQGLTQPAGQPAAGAAPPVPAAPARAAQSRPACYMPTSATGFADPLPWDFDECARREPVLDHDHDPPRVVRRVGWQRCIRCRRPFWSDDVVRLRMCRQACRDNEDCFV